MCSFHDKFSSNKVTEIFHGINSFDIVIIFNISRGKGMLHFLPDLLNNEDMVFPTLIDSLFAENQPIPH